MPRRNVADPVPGGRRGALQQAAAAAQIACLLELTAPKPGNVGRGRDLPGLTYRAFLDSATALGQAFRDAPRGGVGRLILDAVRATRRRVGTNTNLGIILLLAPLVRAAQAPDEAPLRHRLRHVLAGLDRQDARDAYTAIRLARPGGLGRVAAQDVRRPPTEALLECMRRAAGRDSIAREYATGYRVTFRTALPTLLRLIARHVPTPLAIAQTYLTILARHPDTLIERRRGSRTASLVSRAAGEALQAGGFLTAEGQALAALLDQKLRRARPPLNPGTSADITVAALFVWLVQRPEPRSSRPGSSRARPRSRRAHRPAARRRATDRPRRRRR